MHPLNYKKSPLALACLFASFYAAPNFADVYFSEYVEGSSNNKALEIYNSGNSDISLSGYKVEYYFNGSANAGLTINLSGNLSAKGVYLVAHSSANAAILAVANQTNNAGWFNGDDAVVLKNGATILDSIGQVGVDPGIEWGTSLTSTADNTLRRKASITTGRTTADTFFDPSIEWEGFATDTTEGFGSYQDSSGGGTPTDPTPVTSCGAPSILISSIQGSGAASPLLGTNVSVEAIVVASFQGTNQIGGFFLQEPDNLKDNNPATSEGIYIPSTTPVAVGERVRVSGAIAETFNLTQITPTKVSVCASNQTLPSVTGVGLPLGTADELEAVEGMLVSFPQTLTVNETYSLGRYGELLLADGRLVQPTNVAAPGAAANALQAQNNLNKIILDDASNKQNPDPVIFPAPGLSAANTLRSGYTVSGLTGVITYDFSEYRILPTSAPNFVATNPRTAAPQISASANLKVASFNVLNFFNGNGLGGGFPTARGANNAVEFDRQKAKIVSALVGLNADVIGLLELENDGFDNYSAVAELVAALNSATCTNQWTYINPGLNKIGTDEITVGIIYRKDRATAVGQTAILDSAIDSQFIDTKNRPTLAQSFRATQGRGVVTIAINHLKSKGSDCNDVNDPDTGDGQGNCNFTRTHAAQALTNWLSHNPTGVNDGDYLIIGDLNSYAKENPITAITNAGYVDLINKFGGANAYSYVFDGQAGYLDHGLATKSLSAQVLEAADWHINADEPISLDYNTEFKSVNQINSFYANNAYRSSDHDPLVISLKLLIDLDGDGDVDSDDIKIVTAALNTTPSPWDQRDVNGDGIINALDARSLTLQCTRIGCATK